MVNVLRYEICGANHSFMPIIIETVLLDKYINWVATQSENW